jgi:hypothetical protein
MTTIKVTRDEVNSMLMQRAAAYGYTLDDLRAMAQSGTLEEPELRDLWLIWGDTPLSTYSE